MAFNPWFTGLGLGYNLETGKTTGSEWLVRGEVALEDLQYSDIDIIEWSQ